VNQLALDAKGRLAIPGKHRTALAGASENGERTLIVTADPSRCLLVYPRSTWEPIQARLMGLSSFNADIRGLQRLLVGHADEVEMDGAGRILVPPALRQYAGLGHHVVLVGQGNKFELWDDAKWQQATATITFPAGGLPPGLDGFSLIQVPARYETGAKKPSPRWRSDPRVRTSTPRSAAADMRARSLRALAPAGRLYAFDRDPPQRRAHDPFAIRGSSSMHAGSPSSATRSLRGRRAHRRRAPRPRHFLSADRRPGTRLLVSRRRSSRHADGPTRGESAAAFLARVTARELTEVIRDYGEERFAQSIARAIVAARAVAPVVSTRQLAAIVAQAVGARPRGDRSQDPATRTFQALRIFINRELEEIALTLPAIVAMLDTHARLAVISFHSLEDRIVKRFFASASQPFGGDPGSPGWPYARRRCRHRSPSSAARSGRQNPRSRRTRARSAMLRGRAHRASAAAGFGVAPR
jgi:MraZ protein